MNTSILRKLRWSLVLIIASENMQKQLHAKIRVFRKNDFSRQKFNCVFSPATSFYWINIVNEMSNPCRCRGMDEEVVI